MPKSDSKPPNSTPWKHHGQAGFWTLVVCAFLLAPGADLSEVDSKFPFTLPAGTDKLGHGLLFFLEARFLFHSFHQWQPRKASLAAAVGLSVVLGALTEVTQLWVPMREGNVPDFLADTAGALAFGIWNWRLHCVASRRPS